MFDAIKRNLPGIFILTSCFTVLIVIYFTLRKYENQEINNRKKTEFIKDKTSLTDLLNYNLNTLKLLQSYFQKNSKVTRTEFSKIVKSIIEADTSIQAIEWIPVVTKSERSQYENSATKEGYKNFYFKEFDKSGSIIRATDRDFYYPVYYLEPFENNENVFGFDISTYTFTKKNLHQSIQKYGLAFSSGLKLIQDSLEYGLVIYLPVYNNIIKNEITGFITAVYRTSSIISKALSDQKEKVISIYDKTNLINPKLIFNRKIDDRLTSGRTFFKPKEYRNIDSIKINNFIWYIESISIPSKDETRLTRNTIMYGIQFLIILILGLYILQKHSTGFRNFNTQLRLEISQKLSYQTALKYTEEKLFKLLFTTPIPITYIRLIDRKIENINPAFEKKFGYSKNEVIGKTSKELGLWASNETWDKFYKIFYEKGEVLDLETQAKKKNGEMVTCILSGSIVRLAGQDYIYTFFQDISERKIAENRLQLAKERYEDIFNNVSDAIMVYDVESETIEDCNWGAIEMYKFTKDEFRGLSLKEFVGNEYPYNYDELVKKYTTTLSSRKSFIPEWLAKDKFGNKFWVEIGFREMIINGKSKVVTVTRNITERKKIENLLVENEFLFRTQFDNSNIGIAIASPEGYLIRANKKICSILGYTENELQEMHWHEFTYPEDFGKETNLLEKMKSGEIDNYEIDKRFIQKKGDKIFAHISLSCLRNPDSSIHYIIVHIFDLTDRIEMERKLFKTIIETEESERARFAQELHDGLGPILSSIKIYNQWMAKPQANIEISKAIEEVGNLIELANQSVKEISFGLSPHILKDFGLYEALLSFTNKIKGDSTPTIVINCNLTYRIDETIETVLYRVLIECINNSIKHSQSSLINLDINKAASGLKIEYSDNGVGFNLEEVENKKVGMGIYNIQNRIKSINGEISIDSNPDSGTYIKIFLSKC